MTAFFDLPGALLASLMSLEEQGQQDFDKMNNMYGQTDTFLKLLLRIEALQDTAIEMMLGKMLWLLGEEPVASNEGNISRSQILRQQSEQERLATQIFNHIRWCEVRYITATSDCVKQHNNTSHTRKVTSFWCLTRADVAFCDRMLQYLFSPESVVKTCLESLLVKYFEMAYWTYFCCGCESDRYSIIIIL